MTNYTYPQISGGYRWNMLQRIFYAIGRMPDSSCDTSDGTVLSFIVPLTEPEKALVDAIMANNPTKPPAATGTVFTIQDIYSRLDQFKITTAVDWKIYFDESVPGSGVVDRIVLHAPSVLTTSKKNSVKTAYAGLIAEA